MSTLGYFWVFWGTFGYFEEKEHAGQVGTHSRPQVLSGSFWYFWVFLGTFGYYLVLLGTFGYFLVLDDTFWYLLVLLGYFWVLLGTLKRGSMRDNWGLTLVHRMGEGGRIELGVSKVPMSCPSSLQRYSFALSFSCPSLQTYSFALSFRWPCSAQRRRRALYRVTLSSTLGLLCSSHFEDASSNE